MVINLFLPILVPTKRTVSSWHQHHSSPQKKSDDSLNISPGNRPYPSDPEPEKEVMEEKKGRGIVTAHCICVHACVHAYIHVRTYYTHVLYVYNCTCVYNIVLYTLTCIYMYICSAAPTKLHVNVLYVYST